MCWCRENAADADLRRTPRNRLSALWRSAKQPGERVKCFSPFFRAGNSSRFARRSHTPAKPKFGLFQSCPFFGYQGRWTLSVTREGLPRGTAADPLGPLAPWETAVVEEELEQGQVVRSPVAAEEEVVA